MATKPINKWTKLSDTYGGPVLYLADVVNPKAKSGFSTRSVEPEQFLHFELLSPTQIITEGQIIAVPTVPLNFVIRNAYATFTSMTNSSAASTASHNLISQLFITFGFSSEQADNYTNDLFLSLGSMPLSDGGWGGQDSYGRNSPNPYEDGLGESIDLILDDAKVPPARKLLLAPQIKAALTLATISLSFGLPDAYDKVVWEESTIQPATLSVEGRIDKFTIPATLPLGIKINSFLAAQPGVELKGLTLWLRGYFQVPYSPSRKNQTP